MRTTRKSGTATEQILARWRVWVPYSLALGDGLALLVSFYLGRLPYAFYYGLPPLYVLQHWWGSLAQLNLLLFILLGVLGISIFFAKGHYARRKAFWDEAGEILLVFSLLLGLNAAIAFSGKWAFSRLWLFSTWGLAFLVLPAMRLGVRGMLQRTGLWVRPVIIIGGGQNALEAMKALDSDSMLGFKVQRILVPDSTACEKNSFPEDVPVEFLEGDPLASLARLGNPHVVLALDVDQWAAQEQLVRLLGLNYPNLAIAPPLRGLPLFGLEVMHFFSHEVLMLRVRDNLARLGPRLIKRIFDVVVASLLVAILSPVLLFLVWRIRSEDSGPAIYSQERVGRGGRTFRCLKFRSMMVDADARLAEYLSIHPELREEYEKTCKLKNDPRVTRMGLFLRRTSLDELPQIFNVLRGEMSLVGPRPVTRRELDEYYGDIAGLYRLVHPGISGLWQVSGRSDTTYSERIYLDSWYVKNWSLWYDIVILIRTVGVVFRRQGAY